MIDNENFYRKFNETVRNIRLFHCPLIMGSIPKSTCASARPLPETRGRLDISLEIQGIAPTI